MIGISLSGMKSRVQRGRLHLRRLLDECCHLALDVRGRVVECEPRPGGKRPPSSYECGSASDEATSSVVAASGTGAR
jgi:RNA polymerase sigma-70 factor (ECF subfamily)